MTLDYCKSFNTLQPIFAFNLHGTLPIRVALRCKKLYELFLCFNFRIIPFIRRYYKWTGTMRFEELKHNYSRVTAEGDFVY